MDIQQDILIQSLFITKDRTDNMHLSCSFTLFSVRFIALCPFSRTEHVFQKLLYLALLVSLQPFLIMQLSMDIVYFFLNYVLYQIPPPLFLWGMWHWMLLCNICKSNINPD